MRLSSQEALDLDFLLADVSRFIPVNFGRDDPAIVKLNIGYSLAFASATTPVKLTQPGQLADTSS
jgi:hypothetical protein